MDQQLTKWDCPFIRITPLQMMEISSVKELIIYSSSRLILSPETQTNVLTVHKKLRAKTKQALQKALENFSTLEPFIDGQEVILNLEQYQTDDVVEKVMVTIPKNVKIKNIVMGPQRITIKNFQDKAIQSIALKKGSSLEIQNVDYCLFNKILGANTCIKVYNSLLIAKARLIDESDIIVNNCWGALDINNVEGSSKIKYPGSIEVSAHDHSENEQCPSRQAIEFPMRRHHYVDKLHIEYTGEQNLILKRVAKA